VRFERASISRVRWVKKLLYLVVGYALAFALVFSVPEFIHRRAFDQAFSAWYKDPSPQNTAVLRIEQHKNRLIHLQDSAIGALALFVVACGVYCASQLWKRYPVNTRPPSGQP
jgi:hypothetical protein